MKFQSCLPRMPSAAESGEIWPGNHQQSFQSAMKIQMYNCAKSLIFTTECETHN